MKERPILFSAHMVQAILEGRKTMTRRTIILKDKYEDAGEYYFQFQYSNIGYFTSPLTGDTINIRCPYGNIGDRLWVRETWQHTKCLNINPEDENYGYVYRADNHPWKDIENWKWKPSIFMPREASRLMLEITEVMVQRLNDITVQDIESEGLSNNWRYECASPNDWFATLWDSINGKGSFDKNPLVWVITFKKI